LAAAALAAAALAAAALGAGACRSGKGAGGALAPVGEGFAALRARFDADAGRVRVLALLSPT
ncbi:MAG TPA: hypothetical protein VG389_10160, partial [Myxococcota bacterium]|nr:hypothetical protein [Myxococcota bacterium]